MKEYTDHLGNTFSTVKEMCTFYNIPESTYRKRKKDGWSLEKILTTKTRKKPSTDYKGKQFESEHKMCQFYNIKQSIYRWRIKHGWSQKDALLIGDSSKICPCTDHLGNQFPSKTAMAKYYGISNKRLDARLKSGYSLERALSKPLLDYSVADFNGVIYSSIEEMCKAYNVASSMYKDRIYKGWNQKDALLKPSGEHYVFTDHKGVIYSSMAECARSYNIPEKVLYARLASGWNIKTALETEDVGSISTYEYMVIKYCDMIDLKYDFQFLDHECYSSGGKHSRFDFSIPDVGLIEVDGEGHFRQTSNWNFEKAIKDDTLKTTYCEEHNIPLLRIRYDQMQDGTYVDLIEDFITNPANYINQHNKLSEAEYYAERTENLSVASA
jgi:hypothetical protein